MDRAGAGYCGGCGGSYLKGRFKSIKSASYATQESLSAGDCLRALQKRQHAKWEALELGEEYLAVRERLGRLVAGLSEHFRFGYETMGLGVALMDRLFTGQPGLLAQDSLYAGVCLLAAAKLADLDSLVPFLPRLRKHTSYEYSLSEYKAAERKVLDFFGFDYHLPTHFEFVGAYLSGGMVFSNERGCIEGFREVEGQAAALSKRATLSERVHCYRPEALAQAIFLKARESAGIAANPDVHRLYGIHPPALQP